jgi:hypothetical protein
MEVIHVFRDLMQARGAVAPPNVGPHGIPVVRADEVLALIEQRRRRQRDA